MPFLECSSRNVFCGAKLGRCERVLHFMGREVKREIKMLKTIKCVVAKLQGDKHASICKKRVVVKLQGDKSASRNFMTHGFLDPSAFPDKRNVSKHSERKVHVSKSGYSPVQYHSQSCALLGASLGVFARSASKQKMNLLLVVPTSFRNVCKRARFFQTGAPHFAQTVSRKSAMQILKLGIKLSGHEQKHIFKRNHTK